LTNLYLSLIVAHTIKHKFQTIVSNILKMVIFPPNSRNCFDNLNFKIFVIQNAIKQNEKWIFGLKWTNGRILTQTDFVDKIEKWNEKKGTPHFLIQESDKSMGLRITTRKDS